jgi:uncharacterized membrane protein YkoI
MKRVASHIIIARLAVLGLAAAAAAVPAGARTSDVQGLRRAGEIMPFDVIQRRVVQETPGEYMGAQFDAGSRRYRFRFMRDGNVINVDVDARTGERVRPRQSF